MWECVGIDGVDFEEGSAFEDREFMGKGFLFVITDQVGDLPVLQE